MILQIKNLDTSGLLNLNFYTMKDIGFELRLEAHTKDEYFDLYIDGVIEIYTFVCNEKLTLDITGKYGTYEIGSDTIYNACDLSVFTDETLEDLLG